MVWLGTAAGISGAMSLAALLTAFVTMGYAEARASVVFQGLALLFGALMIFLVFLALLNSLIYATRGARLDRFTALAARKLSPEPVIHPVEQSA
jgi:hypothetical protein